MELIYWFLIGISLFVINLLFIRSLFLFYVTFSAFCVSLIDVSDLKIQFGIFIAGIIIFYTLFFFPRKWIKILLFKRKQDEIEEQTIRILSDLKKHKRVKAFWNGIIVKASLYENNLDIEIPKNSTIKVVRIDGLTFVVTNNYL